MGNKNNSNNSNNSKNSKNSNNSNNSNNSKDLFYYKYKQEIFFIIQKNMKFLLKN